MTTDAPDVATLSHELVARPVVPRKRVTARLRLRVTERGVGIAILVSCALAFLIVPSADRTSPYAIGIPASPPSVAHPFGTDMLGRDSFVRVFMAGRLDLAVTLISVIISLAVGSAIGLVVANLPKALREACLRLLEAVIAIPYLVLAIGICAIFGAKDVIPGTPPGVAGVVLALTIVGWVPFANLTIAQSLSLRNRESIIAARVLGYSHARILLRHVAPFVMSANVSYAATQAVANISVLAGLGLLGVGVQQPTPELGLMIQQGVALLPTAPWISLIPSVVIVLLGVGFGLIADSYNQGADRR